MISFYKPTKKGTGSACSFYLSQDGAVMASLLRQDGWNNSTNRASFSKNRGSTQNNIVIKLTPIEVSSIIHSINTSEDWKGFHKTAEKSTSIKFGLYRDRETGSPKGGFTFGVLCTFHKNNDQKASILIGLSESEVIYLKTFLVYCLNKQFELNAFKPKEEKSPNKKPTPTKQKAAKDDFEDDWGSFDEKDSKSELTKEETDEMW